jgi:hypothetical protein
MTDIRHTTLNTPLKIKFLNENRVLSDQHLLPEFVAKHGIDTAIINETHLERIIQPYTIHPTEG